MERRRFEDSFKNAFQDAEVSPSESVWTSIELDLARAEGGKMKRRILFYKMLAAASVVFGMSVAGVGYYMMQSHTSVDGSIAQVKDLPPAEVGQQRTGEDATVKINDLAATENSMVGVKRSEAVAADSKSNPAERNSISSATDAREPAQRIHSDTRFASATEVDAKVANNVSDGNDNSSFNAGSLEVNSSRGAVSQDAGRTPNSVIGQTSIASMNTNGESDASVKKLPRRVKPETNLVESTVAEIDPVQLLVAQSAQRERELADEKENNKEEKNSERIWTSVGVAAGAFSSANSSVSPSVAAFNSTAGQQAKASGVAYSMGVSVGTRLSNRWVLQGGLNYQTQSSDYTASSVVSTSDLQNFYASSMNNLGIARENTKLLNSAPYSVNNNLQFVNVPLQAGYLVVNKKIGVQLNAGISTDLFLQNTITPESGSLDKSTQGAGDESPYRTVNFSGLVGTELTYKFGAHYRVALNPGLRYPMNSIYKSSTGVEAAPLTFDVGLRFRYIFNQ